MDRHTFSKPLLQLAAPCLLLLLVTSVGMVSAGVARAFSPRTQEPASHPCRTCEGAGSAVLPCDYCEASGKAVCRECPRRQSGILGSRRRAILLRKTPEKLSEEDAELKEQLDSLKQLAQLLSRGGVEEAIQKGYLDCPGGCANGQIGKDKKYPCRYCKKKGRFKCPTCKKKGEAACPFCRGKRKWHTTCPECRGSGSAADPAGFTTATAPLCPWCHSDDLASCRPCSGEGARVGFCGNCSNEGKLFCRTCLGTEKKPCNRCRAAGKVRTFAINGEHVVRCDPCDGSGILDCDKCEKGHLPCSWCKGEKIASVLCIDCSGTGFAPCLGCFGGHGRAWEVTAERLEKEERWEVAAAYYDEAHRRYRTYHRDLRAQFLGTDKERKKLQKRHERFERTIVSRATVARKAFEKQK